MVGVSRRLLESGAPEKQFDALRQEMIFLAARTSTRVPRVWCDEGLRDLRDADSRAYSDSGRPSASFALTIQRMPLNQRASPFDILRLYRMQHVMDLQSPETRPVPADILLPSRPALRRKCDPVR